VYDIKRWQLAPASFATDEHGLTQIRQLRKRCCGADYAGNGVFGVHDGLIASHELQKTVAGAVTDFLSVFIRVHPWQKAIATFLCRTVTPATAVLA
jgi:hypothetical protein